MITTWGKFFRKWRMEDVLNGSSLLTAVPYTKAIKPKITPF
jgi:hypothetical protein